jgi:hypothetical protein
MTKLDVPFIRETPDYEGQSVERSHFYEQWDPEIVSSNNSIRNLHLHILV